MCYKRGMGARGCVIIGRVARRRVMGGTMVTTGAAAEVQGRSTRLNEIKRGSIYKTRERGV